MYPEKMTQEDLNILANHVQIGQPVLVFRSSDKTPIAGICTKVLGEGRINLTAFPDGGQPEFYSNLEYVSEFKGNKGWQPLVLAAQQLQHN